MKLNVILVPSSSYIIFRVQKLSGRNGVFLIMIGIGEPFQALQEGPLNKGLNPGTEPEKILILTDGGGYME